MHIVACGKCGEENSEPDWAAGTGDKERYRYICNAKSYFVYGLGMQKKKGDEMETKQVCARGPGMEVGE